MSERDDARAQREAALWETIVANYGERATLDEEPGGHSDGEADRAGSAPAPTLDHRADHRPGPDADPDDEPDAVDDHHFVPPHPPATPLPEPPRLIAWVGVLGVPLLVVVLAFTGWSVPGWAAFGLLTWSLAGFGYLVATMRRAGGADDGDDGARV